MSDDPPATPKAEPDDGPPLVYQSADLLQGRKQVVIQHGEVRYLLIHTAADKLLLQK